MINLAYLWKDTQEEAGNAVLLWEEKGQLSPVGGTLVFLRLILFYTFKIKYHVIVISNRK